MDRFLKSPHNLLRARVISEDKDEERLRTQEIGKKNNLPDVILIWRMFERENMIGPERAGSFFSGFKRKGEVVTAAVPSHMYGNGDATFWQFRDA